MEGWWVLIVLRTGRFRFLRPAENIDRIWCTSGEMGSGEGWVDRIPVFENGSDGGGPMSFLGVSDKWRIKIMFDSAYKN